jgi:hypothetical protein
MPRITAAVKKLATSRDRVQLELAEIAIECKNTLLEDIDIKRLNLKRQVLSKIYELLTEQKKEQEHEELVRSVQEVERLWGHGREGNAERESVATQFSTEASRSTH